MYITTIVREKPPEQLSFEDQFLLMLNQLPDPVVHASRQPYTRTWFVKEVSPKILAGCNVQYMISVLKKFNERWGWLRSGDLSSHYHTFYIPKKSGGMRRIDAPDEDLKLALAELRVILERDFFARSHTAAHAYTKGRSTKTAVEVHQRNKSKWFLKIDLSGFFPSTTLDYTMFMLGKIYPYALVVEIEEGRRELRKAMALGFLNGGLPQGTPLSPLLTNILMTPFDYEFSRYLRGRYQPEKNLDGRGRLFAYTRYADDMHISCRVWFNYREVIRKIKEIFDHFHAPYIIKDEKTHYGSSGGRNWILGMMLNGDNEITIGHKRKEQFRATLFNYCADRRAGKCWDDGELRWLRGIISYYKMINEESAMNTMHHVGGKFRIDIEKAIVQDLCA